MMDTFIRYKKGHKTVSQVNYYLFTEISSTSLLILDMAVIVINPISFLYLNYHYKIN